MPTIGNMIKSQFMGSQGKRNLAFIRAKGKAWLPKLTRKIEGKVKQGRKWIDQAAGVAAAGTDVLSSVQNTDFPGAVNAAEKGIKRARDLGKDVISDPGVQHAAKKVKGLFTRKKRTRTFAPGQMEQGENKKARMSPNDVARMTKSISMGSG